ncbi:replication protein A 70 kDa DNA-binding subunit B, partial [Tanacetum coccineum]
CILCSTNDVVDVINSNVLEKVLGELHELYSADNICQTTNNLEEMQIMYPTEFLNMLRFSSIPNHKLELKVRVLIILLGNHNMQLGDKVLIHRIDMTPTDSSWPFQFRCRQFPIKVCFGHLPVKCMCSSLDTQELFLLPRFLFKFVEYENLKDRHNDDKYLTDVIGILTEWGPLMEKTGNNAYVNSNVRNVVIRDLSDNRVHVTIWGELASKFDDEIIISKNDHSIVVVFTCKLLLTMTSSSHFLLDLELKENDPYRLSPLVPVVFTGMNENRPIVIHISDLFEKLMVGVELDSTFILDVNVVGVDLVNDWKFVQCTECFGKATWNKDHYFCEKKCNRRVINPRQTYKLVLKVGNGCHVMDCVFFNQYARNLLGVSVDDLINKALTLGAGNPYWIEDYFVMNLYGERVVIEIKVDKFNLPPECSRRFTVVKYFGDHPDYIHHRDIIPVAPKLNGADVNGNHVGQSDIMRRSPNDADLNETTNVASFYGQHMQCGITPVSPITKFYDVPGRSMQRDIVSEAILANVADAVDQHKIQHGEEVPYHKDKSDCIPIKDSVNNFAGSLTDLSEVTDDQGGAIVDKSVLNENIYVVASKNDSIDGVVDKSIIDAYNAEAKNIDIVFEGKDEVGSSDILNEVADEVVSDDKVSEAAANDEDMDVDEVVSNDKVSEAAANDEDIDVDDVGHESKISVSAHSDADEELE